MGSKYRTDLGVGITKLNCDVTDKFVLETDSHDTRDSLDYGRFTVGYMSDSSCRDGCLEEILHGMKTKNAYLD